MYFGSDIKTYREFLNEQAMAINNDKYKLLAIDYGRKRIGLAVCDELRKFAIPYQTINRNNINDDLSNILLAITTNRIKGLVIGKPIINYFDNSDNNDNTNNTNNTNDSDNNNSRDKQNKSLQAVLSFSNLLLKFLKNNDMVIPILLYDERYSSVVAKKLFHNYDKEMKTLKSRKKNIKIELDKVAAYVILQDVLDQMNEINIQNQ